MPYRLVVKFPSAASYTLVAAPVTVALTASTATLSKITPPPPSGDPKGTWQLLLSDPNTGGRTNMAGWATFVLDQARDVVYYMSWTGVFNALNLGNGAWYNAGSVEPTSSGDTHNRTYAYDVGRDRITIGNGTYGNYTKDRATRWSPADNSRAQLSDVDPNNNIYRAPSYQEASYYHAPTDSIIAWYGWGDMPLRSQSAAAPYNTVWQNVAVSGTVPPLITNEADNFTSFKTDYDSLRNRYVMVRSNPEEVYFLSGNLTTWSKSAVLPFNGSEVPPHSTWWVYDDKNDQMIGWSGAACTVNGQPVFGEPMTTWRIEFWKIPLEFEKLASASYGDFTPGAWDFVSGAMVWDPVRKRVFFSETNGNNPYRIFVYTPPPPSNQAFSEFTQFTLPTRSGSTYGQNYYGFPFWYGGDSKNINISYCPTNNRVYATGGDSLYSNTLGIWSMDADAGTWRMDSGEENQFPVYTQPLHSYPQPTGYQDGSGLWWMPSRGKFLFGMSVSDSYETEPPNESANWIYARGSWFFDVSKYPVMSTAWSQFLEPRGLWGGTALPAEYPIHKPVSGCHFGGYYDDVTDSVYVFNDGAAGSVSMSVTKVRISDWTNSTSPLFAAPPKPPGQSQNHAAYIQTFGPIAIGRDLYGAVVVSDGAASYAWSICRWNMDTQALVTYYPFPSGFVNAGPYSGGAIKLERSNGKLVWFNRSYPGGVVYEIWVLNPTTGEWFNDPNRPSSPPLIGDATTSLPDGRIALCGTGSSGYAMYHWFYYEVL